MFFKKQFWLHLYWYKKICIWLTCLVLLNLNGGPSKTAIVLSSDPVITLNGLDGLKSHELIGLDCPEISPTDVPVSDMKTCPNLSLPSPTTTILWLSGDQAMSLIGPPIGWNSFLRMCSLFTVSQILTLPDWSEVRDENDGMIVCNVVIAFTYHQKRCKIRWVNT